MRGGSQAPSLALLSPGTVVAGEGQAAEGSRRGTTGCLLQGRKCCEKHRKGLKKTEMKERDGKKRMREGEEKRRRDSRGLQGVNFLRG